MSTEFCQITSDNHWYYSIWNSLDKTEGRPFWLSEQFSSTKHLFDENLLLNDITGVLHGGGQKAIL